MAICVFSLPRPNTGQVDGDGRYHCYLSIKASMRPFHGQSHCCYTKHHSCELIMWKQSSDVPCYAVHTIIYQWSLLGHPVHFPLHCATATGIINVFLPWLQLSAPTLRFWTCGWFCHGLFAGEWRNWQRSGKFASGYGNRNSVQIKQQLQDNSLCGRSLSGSTKSTYLINWQIAVFIWRIILSIKHCMQHVKCQIWFCSGDEMRNKVQRNQRAAG